MAAIVNERDIILQATDPRLEQISVNNITLLASATNFARVSGGIQPNEITIRPILNGKLTGISNLVWTSSLASNLYTVSTDKIVTLPSSSVTLGTPITFTASLVYLGNTYTASVLINSIADAQLLKLDPSDFAFIFENSTATVASFPSQVTFTATKQNITGSPVFTATAYDSSNTSLGSVTLTGSGDSRTLSAANFNTISGSVNNNTRYVKVTATIGTLSDTVSIVRGDNGSDALNMLLSNEAHTVPADSDGTVTSFTGASTNIFVFKGLTNETSSWSFSKTDSTGLTSSLSGNGTENVVVTISALTTAYDSGKVTITATKNNHPTLTKEFSISKSKTGTNGQEGSPGSPGSTGLQGIRTVTAFRLRNQTDAALTTAPSNTSGGSDVPVAPTNWSLTSQEATVGQVVWYSFGRYNPNASTVESIPANTTVWSVPVAASVFQDIKSDNWTGGTPTSGTFTSNTGYYLNKTEGSLYATNAYLRGNLVTGSSGAQRIEINLANSNKLRVYNANNNLLLDIGGNGTASNNQLLDLRVPSPDAVAGYSNTYGQVLYLPYPPHTGATSANAIQVQYVSGSSGNGNLYAIMGRWVNGGNSKISFQGGITSYTYTTDSREINIELATSYRNGSGAETLKAGYFIAGGSGITTQKVEICGINGGISGEGGTSGTYALSITGTLIYNSVTISTPPGNATTYLRGDGTFATPPTYPSGGSSTQVLLGNGTWSDSPQLVNPAATGGYYAVNGGVSKKILDYDNAAMATIVGREITNGGFVVTSNAVRPLQLRGTAVTDLGTTTGGDYTFRNFGWGGYNISPPPGGTLNFLRADGVWAPAAGGGGTTTNSITFNNSGSGAASGSTFNGSSALTVSRNTLGAAATDQTFYIGSTQVAINRASGWLTLNSVDIDGNAGSADYASYAGEMNAGSLTSGTVPTDRLGSGAIANSVLALNSNSDKVWTNVVASLFTGEVGSALVSALTINFRCTLAGQRFNASGSTVTLQSSSDRNLKSNIYPEKLGLNFINSLKPVTYTWKDNPKTVFHGFIAQDVEPLILDKNDALASTNSDNTKAVDYLSIIAPLVKSVQELSAEVEKLKLELSQCGK